MALAPYSSWKNEIKFGYDIMHKSLIHGRCIFVVVLLLFVDAVSILAQKNNIGRHSRITLFVLLFTGIICCPHFFERLPQLLAFFLLHVPIV